MEKPNFSYLENDQAYGETNWGGGGVLVERIWVTFS